MKIDLHVHAKERSRCGKNTETEQVEAAIAAGLDAIVFTDHATLTPAPNLLRLNAAYAPFRIFGGVELNVEGEDWVILGLQDDSLVSETWTYGSLLGYVRKREGFIFLAHPFRYHAEINVDLAGRLPDAIELRSCNTPAGAAGKIHAVSRKLGIPLLCNSDSHNVQSFGRHYNILAGEPTDDASLLAGLRRGVAIVPDWDPATEREEP